ncbi:MAG: hypothetical protein ABSF81_14825 [Bacteroidales bacterium]|jgi:hypothetical protein
MNPISHFSNSEEICCISIGIEREGNTHCGILYKTEKGSFFLHLGNPVELLNESDSNPKFGYLAKRQQYRWLPFINLHTAKQTLIKTKCIAIAETNKSLPFGIYIDEEAHFDAIGKFKMGKDSTGLTCATFVSVLLRSINLKIIDDSSWPEDRPDDLVWLQKLVDYYEGRVIYLREGLKAIQDKLRFTLNLQQTHILRFQKTSILAEIDKLNRSLQGLRKGLEFCFMRFRPEEVAGVCFKDVNEWPFKFEYSEPGKAGAGKIGEDLLYYLKSQIAAQ